MYIRMHTRARRRSACAFSASVLRLCCKAAVLGACSFNVLQPAAAQPAAAGDAALGQSCRAQTYADAAAQPAAMAWPKQNTAKPLGAACWVSAAQLLKQSTQRTGAQAAEPTLVDVRTLALRRAAPLDGAVQMELSDVQHKRFLAQNPAVLVGSGLDYADLTQACEGLRQQGFTQLTALQGGAPAWRHTQAIARQRSQSQPQQPRASFSAESMRVQPIDASAWIASLSQGLQWRVLSLSPAFDAATRAQLPVDEKNIVRVKPGLQGAAAVNQALSQAAKANPQVFGPRKKRENTPQAWIVIAEPARIEQTHVDLTRALAERANWPSDVPVYLLRGGWAAYQRQVEQIHAIRQTAAHRLQAPCGRP